MAGAEGLLRPFGIMVASLPYDNASHCSNLLSGSHPSANSFLFQLKRNFIFTYFLNMAGAEGFEPSNAEIKTPCLAAWRRPNKLLL